MSRNTDELNDKIEELDAATDELWDTKDKHAKKIEELQKEFSETHSELHDMITSYDDDINKISFHEQKIEALLRRVKKLEMGTKTNEMTNRKWWLLVVGIFLLIIYLLDLDFGWENLATFDILLRASIPIAFILFASYEFIFKKGD